MALHVLYVALGFHASHLQALWNSSDDGTMRSGQPSMMDFGEEHASVDEALLAAPLLGVERLGDSAGEEDLGMGSAVAWDARGGANPPAGTQAYVYTEESI